MKNKKTRRFKIRYIVFGLLGVMALAALAFLCVLEVLAQEKM